MGETWIQDIEFGIAPLLTSHTRSGVGAGLVRANNVINPNQPSCSIERLSIYPILSP